MITVTRVYKFSAAHRVEGHSRCDRLHGHNYEVAVAVDIEESEQLLLDCVKLDAVVMPLIDFVSNKYLVSSENISADDPYMDTAIERGDACILGTLTSTPEHLAEYFALRIRELTFGDVVVTVSDTNTSSATYWYGGNV